MLENTELPLLNFLEGQKLKERGMTLAATSCPDWLERARSAAEYIAAKQGEVTINDVYAVVGLPSKPNAAGSVFPRSKFHCVGIDQSARKERHCGIIRRWSLAQ